jgi:hypothetical protein
MAREVDVDGLELEIQKQSDLISQYDLDILYKPDKTGQATSNYFPIKVIPRGKSMSARGTKFMKAKEKVTLYVATNVTGTDLVLLSIIGNAKNPRCYNNGIEKLNIIPKVKLCLTPKYLPSDGRPSSTMFKTGEGWTHSLSWTIVGPNETMLADPQCQVHFFCPIVHLYFNPCAVIFLKPQKRITNSSCCIGF